MIKILQRYVLRDVARVFILAVAIFTGISLLAIIYQFVRAELSLGQMIYLLPYGIPFILPFTLPIATLLATALTYGRLMADNEINAMRTSGVPVRLVVSPAIILGLLLSALSLFLQDQVIPDFNYKIKDLRGLAAKILLNQKEGYNFRRRLDKFYIYASYYRGNEYYGIVVFQVSKRKRMKIVARRGVVSLGKDEEALVFKLYDGSVTTYRPPEAKEEAVASLGEGRIHFPSIDLEIVPRARARREADKSTGELLRDAFVHRAMVEEGSGEFRAEIERIQSAIDGKQALLGEVSPEVRLSLEQEIKALNHQLRQKEKDTAFSEWTYRKEVTEAGRRGALAFACLLSAIFGCTLPILMGARNPLVPFFAGILIVLVVYFPLFNLGRTLAEGGTVSPWLGPWICDIVGGILGAFLLWRTLLR